mgnify:CR=1 FL=1
MVRSMYSQSWTTIITIFIFGTFIFGFSDLKLEFRNLTHESLLKSFESMRIIVECIFLMANVGIELATFTLLARALTN